MNQEEKVEVHFFAPKSLVTEFDAAIEGPFNSNRTAAFMTLMRAFNKHRSVARAVKEV